MRIRWELRVPGRTRLYVVSTYPIRRRPSMIIWFSRASTTRSCFHLLILRRKATSVRAGSANDLYAAVNTRSHGHLAVA